MAASPGQTEGKAGAQNGGRGVPQSLNSPEPLVCPRAAPLWPRSRRCCDLLLTSKVALSGAPPPPPRALPRVLSLPQGRASAKRQHPSGPHLSWPRPALLGQPLRSHPGPQAPHHQGRLAWPPARVGAATPLSSPGELGGTLSLQGSPWTWSAAPASAKAPATPAPGSPWGGGSVLGHEPRPPRAHPAPERPSMGLFQWRNWIFKLYFIEELD